VLFAVLVAGPVVLGLIAMGLLPGLDTQGSTPFWAAVTVVYYGMPVGAIVLLGYRKPEGLLASLGFRPTAPTWLLAGSALGLIVATAFNTIYTALMSLVGFGPPEASMEVMNELAESLAAGPLATLVSVLLVVLVAPLVEEAIFRGVLLSGLMRRFSPAASIAISSTLFAAIHFDPWRAVPLGFLGAVLAYLAWQSRSVWPAVLAHALVNGVAYLIALAMAA
jgi:membrane protease YdiL (CAAX protease family)